VKIFDALQAKFPGRPEAINAVWCAGQCRREDLTAQLVEAQRAATRGGMKPEDLTAANQKVQEILVGLRQAVGPIHAMAENVGRTAPGSAVHQRLLYEAAWGYRSLGDAEIENARQAKQAEALRQARAALAKATPAGQPVPEPAAGDVAASQVPVQPSEMIAQAMYERIIAVAPDSAMAVQARMELAEMYAQRNDSPANIDTAVKLLTDALAKAPPKQLAELIRIRLAGSLLARKDAKGALAQLAAIGEKPVNYQTPPLLNYLSGEAQIQLGDWAKAAEKLVPFRDNPNFRNAGGIADRALLRLAEAYAATQQWEPSRAVLAMALERNKYGPWVDEAYFAMGTSLQKQKRYDEAVKAYIEVIRRTVCETAARAQFQIGLCRLEQSQFEEAARQLLVVPLTYGYPQWSAAARCEAARAYEGLKNNAEAIRLYNETLKDQPTGPWADQAHKRLAELSK
jgi:tetratricopeptide (TPR) repeat protein